VILLHQAYATELAGDRRESAGRRCQIEQAVAAGVARGFQLFEPLLQPIKGSRVTRFGFGIRDAFEQAVRDFVVHGAGCELMQALHQAPTQCVVRHAAASDANDAEFFRQEFDFREIVQRRDHQPAGQIARDTKITRAQDCGVW
jgi:hypothetical protein